jgi:hypothetical protein
MDLDVAKQILNDSLVKDKGEIPDPCNDIAV